MQTGLVFDLQRWSLHDGPGIRTTVFLKGCPLSCEWCHNPESQAFRPELVVEPARCAACGACVDVCPQEGIPAAGAPPRPEAGCTLCGSCADVCPSQARRLLGQERSVPEVMAEVLRDRIFYDESGGGATFSGGEPLAQPQFLMALLRACREQEVHTVIDTCGFASQEILLAAAALADLVLYDLKLVDDARHRAATGVGSHRIVANLRALAAFHPAVRLRVPVVPGVNDDDVNLEQTAALAAELPSVRRVDLLPYHGTGRDKSRRLGRQNSPAKHEPPSPQRLEELARPFRRRGLLACTSAQ